MIDIRLIYIHIIIMFQFLLNAFINIYSDNLFQNPLSCNQSSYTHLFKKNLINKLPNQRELYTIY